MHQSGLTWARLSVAYKFFSPRPIRDGELFRRKKKKKKRKKETLYQDATSYAKYVMSRRDCIKVQHTYDVIKTPTAIITKKKSNMTRCYRWSGWGFHIVHLIMDLRSTVRDGLFDPETERKPTKRHKGRGKKKDCKDPRPSTGISTRGSLAVCWALGKVWPYLAVLVLTAHTPTQPPCGKRGKRASKGSSLTLCLSCLIYS